jgi:hypothetical protein
MIMNEQNNVADEISWLNSSNYLFQPLRRASTIVLFMKIRPGVVLI